MRLFDSSCTCSLHHPQNHTMSALTQEWLLKLCLLIIYYLPSLYMYKAKIECKYKKIHSIQKQYWRHMHGDDTEIIPLYLQYAKTCLGQCFIIIVLRGHYIVSKLVFEFFQYLHICYTYLLLKRVRSEAHIRSLLCSSPLVMSHHYSSGHSNVQ